MPSIDSLVKNTSKFLTKEDCGEAGRNLTIFRFAQQQVGKDGEQEMKYTIEWQERDVKPMVLNKENATRLKMIAKSDDTDQMTGIVVNVYSDPFVQYGGKAVGGLRIRPPAHAEYANTRKPAPTKAAARDVEPEDDGPPSPPLEAYDDKDIPL